MTSVDLSSEYTRPVHLDGCHITNYLRPHESLKGKTPAEVAGVKYPYRNWQDVVAKRRIITPKNITSFGSATIPPIIELPTYIKSEHKTAIKK